MQIDARVSNTPSGHKVEVETDNRKQSVVIPPKNTGRGSSINGGELLLSLSPHAFATIFIAKRSIDVEDVKVEVTGTFGNPGEPAHDISYRVEVRSNASQAAVDELIRATDPSPRFRTLFVLVAKFD